MSIKATCPHCDSVYNLADTAAGKRVKCKKCDQPFTVIEEALEAEPAADQLHAGAPTRLPPPARRSRDLEDEDYDDDRPRRRPQRELRKRESSGLAVPLIIGFGILGVGLLALIAILVWMRTPSAEQANNQAPPATAPVANAPPQNPPAQATNNAQAAPNIPVTDKPVVLFNGKVSQSFPRPGLRFSVEYKFQNGSAVPGQRYFLIIEPEQGDGYEVSFNWTELGKEDTLRAETIMPAFGARGPFTMYLQRGHLGLSRRGRETISNKLVVNMAAPAQGVPGAGGPPIAGGGGPGVPPAMPPRVERTPLTEAEITSVVAELESGDPHRTRIACAKLVNARPSDRRDAVSKALEKAITHSDMFVRQSVAQALAVWGTKESVPALIKAADDREFAVRWAVLEALVPFKDERAAAKLAEHLVDFGDRGHASKALQEIGSAAEKEVVKYVDHQDWGVRFEACKILKVIGTKNSLEALRKAQQDSNGLVKNAADEAAQACARR